MARRKKWPHWAEWLRRDAVEYCTQGRNALQPLIYDINGMTNLEKVQRIAIALDSFQNAILALEKAKQLGQTKGEHDAQN